MRVGLLMAGLAFAVSMPLLLHSQTVHQGRIASPFSESRVLADSQFGNNSTFGDGATVFGWSIDGELPLGPSLRAGGRRFEYHPSFTVFLGPKVFHRNGAIESRQSFEVNNQGLIWIKHRIAFAGGYKYARYWAEGLNTGQISRSPNLTYISRKSGWVPNIGVV